jgi:transcriptional regulator with XRE-family HTH domain
MDKNISTMLREIKAAKGCGQPTLARELDTSQPTVNRILKGQTECRSGLYSRISALHSEVVGQGRRKDDQALPASVSNDNNKSIP